MTICNRMAQFYGSAPGEDPGQNSYGTQYFEREEIISSLQDGQSALVVCNQMHSEIRNLQLKIMTLSNKVEELKSTNSRANAESTGSKKLGSKKIPKRLIVTLCCTCHSSVSCNAVIIMKITLLRML